MLNLISSESFTNDASTGVGTFRKDGNAGSVTAAQSTLTAEYDLASRGYTITVDGRSRTFLPSDIDASQSNSAITVYVKSSGTVTDSLTLTKAGTSGRFNYQFVGGGFWQRTAETATDINGNFEAFAYGIETADSALPRSGRAEYTVDLIGVLGNPFNVRGITGNGIMQVDFTTGTIVTHGSVVDSSLANAGSFSSEARIAAAANSFTGNFRYNGFGEYQGRMDGRFYGPAAQEVGAAFSASGQGTDVIVGALIGRGATVTAINGDLKNLAINQFFSGTSTTLNTTLIGTSGSNNGSETFSASSNVAGALVVNYDATSRFYTLIGPNRSQYFFGNRDRGTIRENLTATTPVNNLDGFAYPTFTGLKYAASSRWLTATGVGTTTQYQIEDFIYGMRTSDGSVPRTGSASYAIGISGVAADSDFVNLALISGFGALNADFATGALTLNGQIRATEDYFISGRARLVRGGFFNGSGTLSSSANSFTGSFNFDGLGNYTGTMNGAFFGPAADEVAAAWRASDGSGGFAAGTFVGGRDASVSVSTRGILSLTAPTDLTFFEQNQNHRLGAITKVNYNPASQTYTLTLQDPGLQNAPIATVALSGANRDAVNSTTTYDAHSGSITINRGLGPENVVYNARLLNLAATNPTIRLTYSGLGSLVVPVDTLRNFVDRHYFAYGVQTPSFAVPRSGSATYSGIALGTGSVEDRGGSTTAFYDLVGTNNFSANFASGDFTSTLRLTGTNRDTGATFAFSPYDFNGAITQNSFTTANNGRTMTGSFFGPNAEEMGGWFRVFEVLGVSTIYDLYGAVVGKKCPTASPC